MQEPEREQPTLFYKYFEDTLNYFKSNILSSQPGEPQIPPTNTPLPNIPLPPPTSHLQTPLQQEQHTFETSLESLKKIAPQIKGTKLDYMIQRFDKEHVYMYV
jgi:hypothetical protein